MYSFRSKIVYISGLFCFGIGMMVLAICPTKLGVLLLSVSAGIVYATVFTIPYLLIANYHASGTVIHIYIYIYESNQGSNFFFFFRKI